MRLNDARWISCGNRRAQLVRGAGLLAAAVTLACSTPSAPEAVWVKEGASEEDLQAAQDACLQEAVDVHGDQRRFDHVARGSAFMRCMTERGWRQEAAPESP